jgi:hypothetical protein
MVIKTNQVAQTQQQIHQQIQLQIILINNSNNNNSIKIIMLKDFLKVKN